MLSRNTKYVQHWPVDVHPA